MRKKNMLFLRKKYKNLTFFYPTDPTNLIFLYKLSPTDPTRCLNLVQKIAKNRAKNGTFLMVL